jgi:hypothetical protein
MEVKDQLHAHCYFTSGEERTVPRAGLDAVEKRKITCPLAGIEPRFWYIHSLACCYTDWAIPYVHTVSPQ